MAGVTSLLLRLAPVLMWGLAASGCSEMWRWGGDDGRAAKAAPRRAAPVRSADAAGRGAQYVVQRGDTLYSIAFRNQLDYRQVAAWNRIGSEYHIYPGQVLRLTPPGTASRAPAESRPRQAAPQREIVGVAPDDAADAKPRPELERYYKWQWPLQGALAKTYSPDAGFKGLNIAGQLGQSVIAAAPGRVVYSGSGLKGYGELVIIKHDETYLSAYGYNRKRLVEEGQLVAAGQAIAELGLGPEQKPVLHFEIRAQGKPINPLKLLPADPK
jgi:lipoprotein NlpD